MAYLQLSHNDLDGIACSLLGRKIGVKYNYPCSYDESSKYFFLKVLQENVSRFYEDVHGLLITDINITPTFITEIEKIIPGNITVKIIDHHEDSLREHNTYKVYHNTEMSATLNMYNLVKDKIDVSNYNDFINAVNAYDIWNFELSPFAVDLQRVFYYYVFMCEKFKYTKYTNKLKDFTDLVEETPPTINFKPDWYERFLTEYSEIKDPLIKSIQSSMIEFEGLSIFKFPKDCNAPAFEISILALEEQINNFILLFVDEKNYTISLRTNNDTIKVNELALTKGGGGHSKAASFRIPLDNDLLKNTIKEVATFYNR